LLEIFVIAGTMGGARSVSSMIAPTSAFRASSLLALRPPVLKIRIGKTETLHIDQVNAAVLVLAAHATGWPYGLARLVHGNLQR
jgi:hypothetical protein